MEEDIKILEEFKTKGYAMLLMKYGDRNTTNLKLERALENILKAYREQEEKLNIKKNTPEWEYQYWEARKEVNNEWKSKIKEKIEELKEQRRLLGFKTYLRREDMLNDDRAIACEIQVLQDLLEGEDE